MNQNSQLTELITEMEGTAKYFLRLIDEAKKLMPTEQKATLPAPKDDSTTTENIKMEDVRAVLATKAKDGYKNEVRALLNKYGAESLSALDIKHYTAVIEEARGIGHD